MSQDIKVVLNHSTINAQLLNGKAVEKELLRVCKTKNPLATKFDVHHTKTRLVVRPVMTETTAKRMGYYMVSVPTRYKYKLFSMSKVRSKAAAQRIADYYSGKRK